MYVSLVRSAAVAAGVLGGIFGPFAIDSGLPGLAPAQAKEYYTKKRVNGRWVNGRFAKRSAPNAKVTVRAPPARVTAPARVIAPPRVAAPPSAAGRVAEAKPSSAAATAPPVPAPSPAAPAAPAVRANASGSPSATPSTTVPALAEDGRMQQLQEALQARTQSLLVTGQNSGPNPSSPSSRLQEALQARSRNILVTSLIDPAPAAIDLSGPSETASLGPVRSAMPRAELRSVTFDFVSGVKTTVFGDGTTATEAFDAKVVRDLALRRSPALN